MDLVIDNENATTFQRDWFWRSAAMSLMNVPLEHCSSGALMRFFAQFIGHNDYQVGSPRCGLADLFLPAAEDLITNAGGSIHTNSAVLTLSHSGGRCEGAILRDGSRLQARWCVAARTARSVPPSWPDRDLGASYLHPALKQSF